MKKALTTLIALLVVCVLFAYMFTYQVRYDEKAILTTFRKADKPQYDAEGNLVYAGSLVQEPGLHYKLPWPIQDAQKYSNKLHILEDQLVEIQTADGYAVIVSMYLTWRIDDPYAFYVSLKDVGTAEKKLQPLLRSLEGVISTYRFNQLVNTDTSKLRLDEIEQLCATSLRDQLAAIQPGYGIHVERIGLRRLILPEKTTEKVFERMRTTRQRLAEKARAEGDAQAATIISEAKSAQQRILAFAERRAQSIRAEGDREAAMHYASFRENESLAIFLRKLQTWKEALPNNTTFILDARDLGLSELLSGETTE